MTPPKVQCVILAGGLATRMRPITEKIPKALIPILDEKPFLAYQLDWLSRHGVTDVVFSIGYRGELIRDYVGDGARWKLDITYVDEGQNLRGTAGALRKALDEGALEESFLVTYGDSFLPVDFGAVLKQLDSRALMTVYKNAELFDASNVCFDGRKITLYDKWVKEKPASMQYIDYGLSAFRRDLIEHQIPPDTKSDLADLFHRLSLRGELAGLEMTERFYEIGSPAGLEDFRRLCSLSG